MADTSETNRRASSFLALPNIKRIRNIAEFMAQPENLNAEIEKVTDRMTLQAEQCRLIAYILKEQIQLKRKGMRKIKTDLLQLQEQLSQPDAIERFVVAEEQIPVEFADEPEPRLLTLPRALDQYNLKMGTVYGEILALDSDLDYVVKLKLIAEVNKKAVRDWFAQKHAKDGETYAHFNAKYLRSQDDSSD